MDQTSETIVQNSFSASVLWMNTLGGGEFVKPLIYDGDPGYRIKTWFLREKPDAIIVGTAVTAQVLRSKLGPLSRSVCFALAEHTGELTFVGIDQRPELVGAAAVEQLDTLLLCGEKGAPRVPSMTTIEGKFVENRETLANGCVTSLVGTGVW